MKKALLIWVAVLYFGPMPCLAKRKWKEYTPLRSQVLLVKTVVLAGGPPDTLDKATAEIAKWGRFQVVSDPEKADVVLQFTYGPTASGYWSESFTMTDAKTGEVLHEDGRVIVNSGGAVPTIVTALRHCGMACEMLKDLRKRIEATEAANALEYAIALAARTIKYFADTSMFDERMASMAGFASADTLKGLKDGALRWRALADDLSKTNSAITQFFDNATEDDLLSKHNVEQTQKYRDDTLARMCPALEVQKNINHGMDGTRAGLSPDVILALQALEADAATLSADCNSEQALRLLKK